MWRGKTSVSKRTASKQAYVTASLSSPEKLYVLRIPTVVGQKQRDKMQGILILDTGEIQLLGITGITTKTDFCFNVNFFCIENVI